VSVGAPGEHCRHTETALCFHSHTRGSQIAAYAALIDDAASTAACSTLPSMPPPADRIRASPPIEDPNTHSR